MKRIIGWFLLTFMSLSVAYSNENIPHADVNLIEISQQLLLAAKTKAPTDALLTQLKNIEPAYLVNQLVLEDQKKAFWINIYNACTQVILAKDPDKYKKRASFFGSKQIVIAGNTLSLDDIEHGILRHSKIKWSLGYFNKWFPNSFEKQNRVSKVDYRIHFSLNCGAKSCPPIAFYKPEQLEKQLEIATKVYLTGECDYNDTTNVVSVPALMGWFRHDFGGKKKMKVLLKKLAIIPQDKNPAVHFKKYDWNLYLENYKNE